MKVSGLISNAESTGFGISYGERSTRLVCLGKDLASKLISTSGKVDYAPLTVRIQNRDVQWILPRKHLSQNHTGKPAKVFPVREKSQVPFLKTLGQNLGTLPRSNTCPRYMQKRKYGAPSVPRDSERGLFLIKESLGEGKATNRKFNAGLLEARSVPPGRRKFTGKGLDLC